MAGQKRRILFVCIHNSARGQMAEAFLNKLAGNQFMAESAGIDAGKMNPNVISVMQESGIDLSKKGTQRVAELVARGEQYDAVITVCDAANAARCPVFPGEAKRIAWSFEDPSTAAGTQEQRLFITRKIRDEIEASVKKFVEQAGEEMYWS